MRGTPITGSSRGVSITDAVSRAQRILQDRPEPRGRDRYANRTNRPPRGGDARQNAGDAREAGPDEDEAQPSETAGADASNRPAD